MSTLEVYKLMGINKYSDSLRSRSLLGIHQCCQWSDRRIWRQLCYDFIMLRNIFGYVTDYIDPSPNLNLYTL
ncbi:hypothetical protein [Nostoc sp.]|uniref:hypothetical protein n=1 Tax=Nostoc sp. TaxID=1180 RepID=UPI002FFC408A